MTEKAKNHIEILSRGGVGVILTDTIYGLVGQALNKSTVERIYQIKGRAPEKPCIVLISDISDLNGFSVFLSDIEKGKLEEFWPGPISVILKCDNDEFEYLHRGTRTLAFRLPRDERLGELLGSTGPLIAPSANPEGLPPAENIDQAKKYFGDKVDVFVDGGEIVGKPSKLIRLKNDGSVDVLRA